MAEIITAEDMLEACTEILEVAKKVEPDKMLMGAVVALLPLVCSVLAQINESLAKIAENTCSKTK